MKENIFCCVGNKNSVNKTNIKKGYNKDRTTFHNAKKTN